MLILQLLIFAIPVTIGGVLHMIAVRIKLLEFLKIPLDLGKTYRGKRIFGDHKTFRGILLMMLFTWVGTAFLEFLSDRFEGINKLNIFDFDSHSALFYGLILGLAYTLAELPNSFFKRQSGIPEGSAGTWINVLVDQSDSVLACLLVMWVLTPMSATFFFVGWGFYIFVHLTVNFLLFLAGIRKKPL